MPWNSPLSRKGEILSCWVLRNVSWLLTWKAAVTPLALCLGDRTPCVSVSLQLMQALLEKHVSSLQAQETWGSSLLALGLWPDSLPSALFTTEDSHLSKVRGDGQILAYCLNRLSMKTSNWARLAEPWACVSLDFSSLPSFQLSSFPLCLDGHGHYWIYLTRMLRDHFPHSFIVCCDIAPYLLFIIGTCFDFPSLEGTYIFPINSLMD